MMNNQFPELQSHKQNQHNISKSKRSKAEESLITDVFNKLSIDHQVRPSTQNRLTRRGAPLTTDGLLPHSGNIFDAGPNEALSVKISRQNSKQASSRNSRSYHTIKNKNETTMKNKSLFFNKAVSRPASLEAYSNQSKNKVAANVKLK